jgi:hypothetical protein
MLLATDLDWVDMGPADMKLPSVISVGSVDKQDIMAMTSNYGRYVAP